MTAIVAPQASSGAAATWNRPRVAPPRHVVELIGPAGCGKSTVIGALRGMERTRTDRGIWGQPRMRLAREALTLAPLARRALQEGAPFRAQEYAQMSRVDCLRWRLDARTATDALILDEGPVFALAWMRVFHGGLGGSARQAWRERAAIEWAERLTLLVRLDATDATLAQRIRERAKPHMIRGESEEGIRRFTDRFRLAFDDVLDEMRRARPIPVIWIDTDAASPGRAALHVRTALDSLGSRQ